MSVLTKLMEYLTSLPRAKANNLLATYEEREKLIPTELFARYEEIRKNELFHIHHVRKCMNTITSKGNNKHDWSKDELYIFITICAFQFLDECDTPDETREKYIEDHYRKEAHHPEHESLTGKELKKTDIMETAVDRMSRNLQFNKGVYNEDQLEQYCPLFHKNQEERTELYKKYTELYKNLVRKLFQKMKREEKKQEEVRKALEQLMNESEKTWYIAV